MNSLNIDQIGRIKDPLSWTSKKTQLMIDSCREVSAYHQKHCPEIKSLFERYHFQPQLIKEEKDLALIPSIGVSAMKYFLLLSRDEKFADIKLTSSGTKGQKTQVWFDKESINRVQGMIRETLAQEELISSTPTNYIVFAQNPHEAKNLGVAKTSENQLQFAPARHIEYALNKNNKGEWFFDKHKLYKTLLQYEKESLPIRLLGLPAFIYDFILYLKEQKKKFTFNTESLILTGGGWKAQENKLVDRQIFRNLCFKHIGIPQIRIRDAWGFAEHSSPYYECSHHRFHIPFFNRVLIRNPRDMSLVKDGEKGLMQFITPFNTMMPTLSLLSTDWGMRFSSACDCGKNSPTFKFFGRGGMKKNMSCALSADAIREKGKKKNIN